MTELQDELNKSLQECPTWIVNESVSELKNIITEEKIIEIRKLHKINPEAWWAEFHFGWGMSIRNYLRDKVCLDDKLPTGNWDDYYIQFVELICGLRTL